MVDHRHVTPSTIALGSSRGAENSGCAFRRRVPNCQTRNKEKLPLLPYGSKMTTKTVCPFGCRRFFQDKNGPEAKFFRGERIFAFLKIVIE
ncbi:hypothetical protein PC41400_08660 [Paenibacillus chitinolyticus]|uniref:Uncharacterized protein n=1 Tax=Paenibacillus chitinolyticus TaxID=79263 RepID=A0A410WTS2_9BACL|nr:hypothetical protein PC41400_08660 [Paenibacillus chitinolyticus]